MSDDKAYFVVEIPRGWDPLNPCLFCGNRNSTCMPGNCPLSTARRAVEVKDSYGLEYYAVKKDKEPT